MKKPIEFRQETWDYIVKTIGQPDSGELAQNPGKVAIDAGILLQPLLLADTVIELPDECEYVIRLDAAEALSRGDDVVTLERLYDKKAHRIAVGELRAALKLSRVFDQLEPAIRDD